MDSQEPLIVEEFVRAPSMVVKSFTTKAFEQKVKMKASGDDSVHSPDYLLQQARVAHGRSMRELLDPSLLRRQSKSNLSMIRLQAEDYLGQRPDTLLTDAFNDEDTASEDDDEDDDNDGGDDDEDPDGQQRRSNSGVAGQATRMKGYPPIIQIHRPSDGYARDCSDGASSPRDPPGPREAFQHGAMSPQPPPGPPPGAMAAEPNRRADDLLNRYRQLGRGATGTLGLDASVRAGNSFTAGGGGGMSGATGDYSVRNGRAYTSGAVSGLSRIVESSAGATAPVAASNLGADGLMAARGTAGSKPLPRRTRSSNNGMVTIAAPVAGIGSSSSLGGGSLGATELPKRGVSYHSLLRPAGMGLGGPQDSALDGGGGAGGSPRHSLDVSTTTRYSSRASSSNLEQPIPGLEFATRSPVSPMGARADRSLHGRRVRAASSISPLGGGLASPFTGGSAALAAQMAAVVEARASEPSVRIGASSSGAGAATAGGGSVYGKQDRSNALLVGGYSTAEGEPQSSPQLPDLLSCNATPAAAALFKAITGAEPVGRAPPELPERSNRSVRGSQLQQQFLATRAHLTGDGGVGVRRRGSSGTNLDTGVPRGGSSVKLPTINPSGGSFTGSGDMPFQRSSVASTADGATSPVPRGSGPSFAGAGAAGRRPMPHAHDPERSDDEAGLVSRVKGLFGILKR